MYSPLWSLLQIVTAIALLACQDSSSKKGQRGSRVTEQEQRLRESVEVVERKVDQAVAQAKGAYDQAVRAASHAKTKAEDTLKEMDRSAQDLIENATTDAKQGAYESSEKVVSAVQTVIGSALPQQRPTHAPHE